MTTQPAPVIEHHDDHFNYLPVFLTLCGLTLVSVAADLIRGPQLKLLVIVIAMSVALAKASYVILYFMHIKYEKAWKYILLAPTIAMAIGLPLSLLPDISFEYYPADTQLQLNEQLDTNGFLAHPHDPSTDSEGHH